jgi:DeoR family transcriptional regulator, suf operon transcriptional repressor
MRNRTVGVAGFRGLQAELLVELKKSQPCTVKALARRFRITPNGLRRHLKTLQDGGVVRYRREVHGVGGPMYAYSLTERGEALFPRAYEPLLAEALAVVREQHGIEGVVQIFRRQWGAVSRGDDAGVIALPANVRASHLAQLRTRQGYMAEAEMASATEGTIREHNCAIREVAEQFPEVCEAETQFFAEVLGAVVERQGHILNGCNACEYHVHFPEEATESSDALPPTASTMETTQS